MGGGTALLSLLLDGLAMWKMDTPPVPHALKHLPNKQRSTEERDGTVAWREWLSGRRGSPGGGDPPLGVARVVVGGRLHSCIAKPDGLPMANVLEMNDLISAAQEPVHHWLLRLILQPKKGGLGLRGKTQSILLGIVTIYVLFLSLAMAQGQIYSSPVRFLT